MMKLYLSDLGFKELKKLYKDKKIEQEPPRIITEKWLLSQLKGMIAYQEQLERTLKERGKL